MVTDEERARIVTNLTASLLSDMLTICARATEAGDEDILRENVARLHDWLQGAAEHYGSGLLIELFTTTLMQYSLDVLHLVAVSDDKAVHDAAIALHDRGSLARRDLPTGGGAL